MPCRVTPRADPPGGPDDPTIVGTVGTTHLTGPGNRALVGLKVGAQRRAATVATRNRVQARLRELVARILSRGVRRWSELNTADWRSLTHQASDVIERADEPTIVWWNPVAYDVAAMAEFSERLRAVRPGPFYGLFE